MYAWYQRSPSEPRVAMTGLPPTATAAPVDATTVARGGGGGGGGTYAAQFALWLAVESSTALDGPQASSVYGG